jgi:hypothetical protein
MIYTKFTLLHLDLLIGRIPVDNDIEFGDTTQKPVHPKFPLRINVNY